MLKLMGKEINAILGAQMILIWTYVCVHYLNLVMEIFDFVAWEQQWPVCLHSLSSNFVILSLQTMIVNLQNFKHHW